MAIDHRIIRTHHDLVGIVVFGFVRGNIFRDIDNNWPRPTGGCNVERLLDRHGQIFYVFHQKIVLHTRTRDPNRINFLKRVVADEMRRHLAGKHHHRNGIHIRRRDASHRIGRARAGGHKHHTRTAGRARIAVRRVRRTLLVAHQNMLHFVLFIKRVVNVEHRPAGIPEHILDTFVGQASHNDFGTGQFHDEHSSSYKEKTP